MLMIVSHWMACLWAMGALMEADHSYTWLHDLCVRRGMVWAALAADDADDAAAESAAPTPTPPAPLLADDDAAFICAIDWHHFEARPFHSIPLHLH